VFTYIEIFIINYILRCRLNI